MTGKDLTWPEVTSFCWKSPGRVCRRPIIQVLGAFELLQGWNTQVAVTWQKMTSSDRKRAEVTRKDVIWTEVTWKWLWKAYKSSFGYVWALHGCNSQEVAAKWQEMTSHDLTKPEVIRKWHHLTASHLEAAVKACKLSFWVRLNSYSAVTRWRMPSRDRKWQHLTGRDLKWPESDVIWPEVTLKWL